MKIRFYPVLSVLRLVPSGVLRLVPSGVLRPVLSGVLMLILSGCVYADIKIPYDDDLNYTQLGAKTGRASSHSILWLVAWGDEGIDTAAKSGGLKVINHADQEIFTVLFGLYVRHTIIVYGD